MTGKRKILATLLAGIVLLIAVAAIALTRDYDSPELGRALLNQVGQQAGLELEAEGFHLNLLRGLRLENVEVVSRGPGSELHAKAHRLVLSHRLGPLLRGQVLVEEIRLERPEIELVSSAATTAPPAAGTASPADPGAASPAGPGTAAPDPGATSAAEGGTSPLEVHVSRFVITDGHLVVHSVDPAATTETTEISGLNLEIREIALDPKAASAIQGLSAHGEMTADEVKTSAALAENARGQVHLAAGHLRIENFELPTAQGRLVVGELDADLNTDPYTFKLSVQGDPLNTNLIVGAEADDGLGPGTLALDITGDGSADGALAGQGTLAFSAGKLPGLPVLASLEKLVTGTPIIGESYEPFEVRFTIRENNLEIEPFEVRCGDLRLALSGSLGLLGDLALHTALVAPRKDLGNLEEIPKEVVELLTDADGHVNLPILIAGTQEIPKTAFDRSGWGKMAGKRLEQEAKKELGKALGNLFGKKKKDQ